MTSPSRTITRSPAHPRELTGVLQAAAVAELLCPSRCLWLATPRPGDAAILDNRGGSFAALRPLWGHRLITLTDFMLGAMEVGTHVVTAVPAGADDGGFLTHLRSLARESG